MMGYGAPRLGSTIKTLLIVNIALYVLTIIPGIGAWFIKWGALVPKKAFAGGQLWRLVTYMFLHDPHSSFHLLFNMLALWMFSQEIESMWGSRRFITFYFISGVGAGLLSLIHLFIPSMSTVGVIGASGAILALLTVYAWYFPHRNILLFFIIPVNIRVVVIGYALISLFGTISPHGMVSHITHLGGIVMAIVYLKLYPVVTAAIDESVQRRSERTMRRNVEEQHGEKKFFEEQIDPILAKISQEGMSSLSPQEKKILMKAARSKKSALVENASVIPMALFKKDQRKK